MPSNSSRYNRQVFGKEPSLLGFNQDVYQNVEINDRYVSGLRQLCVLNNAVGLKATTGVIDLQLILGGFKLNPLGYGINVLENGASAGGAEIPNSQRNNFTEPLSILCTFSYDTLPDAGNNVIVSKFSSAGDDRSWGFTMRRDAALEEPGFSGYSNGLSGSLQVYRGRVDLQSGVKYHCFCQWETERAIFSVNGGPVEVQNRSDQSLFQNSTNLTIGNFNNPDRPFDGQIYFLAIWHGIYFSHDEAQRLSSDPYKILTIR